MPEGYLHLTCEQRCQIYALLQSGRSQAHIARQIGVDPSTISRELVRNTGARGYRFKQAHEKASQRRQEASDKPRKMTPDLVELIEEKLTQEQWSPDQISGRLAKDGVAFISHERIYQHVWKDKKDGGTLYLHLRHSGKKYNRRKGKNSGRGLIPNRVDIDQRPPIVAAKSRIGDWEADTIIGANHKGVVMSHVERTSKYTKLAKLPDKNADSVVQACTRVLLPLADQIETITYDNGTPSMWPLAGSILQGAGVRDPGTEQWSSALRRAERIWLRIRLRTARGCCAAAPRCSSHGLLRARRGLLQCAGPGLRSRGCASSAIAHPLLWEGSLLWWLLLI